MSALDAERHESARDESGPAAFFAWMVFGLVCGLFWSGILAGVWWLTNQTDEVIVKIVGGVALLLGSALVGEALAHLERAK